GGVGWLGVWVLVGGVVLGGLVWFLGVLGVFVFWVVFWCVCVVVLLFVLLVVFGVVVVCVFCCFFLCVGGCGCGCVGLVWGGLGFLGCCGGVFFLG
ncbi:hypothetical protein DVA80_20795, partial [Acinetobacter baumannii]